MYMPYFSCREVNIAVFVLFSITDAEISLASNSTRIHTLFRRVVNTKMLR
jgi:hypothetical protein